jgi:lambda family phage portal protein
MGLLSTFKDMLKRDAAKPQQVRRFEGAGGGRRFSSSQNFGSIREATTLAAPQLRSRTRGLVNNNPWCANGVDSLVTALVGTGITPAAKTLDRAERRRKQKAFAEWAKSCDHDGLTDYYGLQAMAARALLVDGESFIHMRQTESGLKLQLMPAELIDSPNTSPNIVSGIEFNSEGQRIAYHVRKADSLSTIRVPAEDMIHIFMPLGAGQVRGVSWFASIILKCTDLDQLEDALLKGFQIAAMHAGFVTSANSDGALPYDGSQTGSELESGIEPGTLKVLPFGTDVKFNSPAQAMGSNEFLQYQLRAIAAGLGVPEFLLTGDMRGANYSSMRSALVSFRQRIERIQYQILIPQFLDRVWQRAMMFEDGDLSVEHYPPALPWVDPLKDVEATTAEITAGLTSRRQAVARRGYDVEDLDDEIKADRDREAALGLQFVTVSTQNESTPPND